MFVSNANFDKVTNTFWLIRWSSKQLRTIFFLLAYISQGQNWREERFCQPYSCSLCLALDKILTGRTKSFSYYKLSCIGLLYVHNMQSWVIFQEGAGVKLCWLMGCLIINDCSQGEGKYVYIEYVCRQALFLGVL